MTYINDNDFVHSVFFTIEKRVYDQTMRNKLHEYFTRNVHHMDYDLFLLFSRAIGELRKVYTQNDVKFSNSFILVLLTYLKESSDVFPKDADVVRIFIDRFMKKTDSERIMITIDHDTKGFECLRFLASKLNIYIGINNVDDRVVRNRSNDHYNFRRNSVQETGRRERNRSRSPSRYNVGRRASNVPPRSNNPNTVYASHVTQDQRMEIERQRELHIPPVIQQQPPVMQIQQNADVMIARLVEDNHSLYAALTQRDSTINQLRNELEHLRRLFRC